jgi:hypothetical protein
MVAHGNADLATGPHEPVGRDAILGRRLRIPRRMEVIEHEPRRAGHDRLAKERRRRDGRVRHRSAKDDEVLEQAVAGVEEERAHDLPGLGGERAGQVTARRLRVRDDVPGLELVPRDAPGDLDDGREPRGLRGADPVAVREDLHGAAAREARQTPARERSSAVSRTPRVALPVPRRSATRSMSESASGPFARSFSRGLSLFGRAAIRPFIAASALGP